MTLTRVMILPFPISNNHHLLLRFVSFWFGSNNFNFALKINNYKKNENENHYFKKSPYKKPFE